MKILNTFPCNLTTEGIISYIEKEVKYFLSIGKDVLIEDPGEFMHLEESFLEFGRELAGYLTAAVLASPEVEEAIGMYGDEVRKSLPVKMKNRYCCPRTVLLASGVELTTEVTYYSPVGDKGKVGRKRGVGRRGKEPAGFYPEWAVLGIREGISPLLQSEVGRLSALLPSFETAREELHRRGVSLDVKTVQRVTWELGFQSLTNRKDALEKWRKGELEAGDELEGKRVAVSIDGGRARTRVSRKGRKTEKGRHRYNTPWREPKMVVIYVLDETGRIDRACTKLVDSTLLGPDALMELTAYHLFRLGASKAKDVVFLADGAEWIWDRVPMVAQLAGIPQERWHQAVDLSHVVSHIANALNQCKNMESPEKKKMLKRLKRWLVEGKFDEVISYLNTLKRGRRANDIQSEISYIEKRTHLMQYARLREKHLPIGSGAVESMIRRVINLRVKSPGIFWDEAHLEAIIYLRAQALTNRWEELMTHVYEHSLKTRKFDWKWKATSMSIKKQETTDSTILTGIQRNAA
jgi:hypothetical protein